MTLRRIAVHFLAVRARKIFWLASLKEATSKDSERRVPHNQGASVRKQADESESPQPESLKQRAQMVSKCANPACSTPFHYLREGKIFRVEVEATPPTTTQDRIGLPKGDINPFLVGSRKPMLKLEHFWLCGPCSKSMNLLFDKDNGITVIPKIRARAAVAS